MSAAIQNDLALTPEEVAAYYRSRVPGVRQSAKSEWRGPCPIHNGDGENFAVDSDTGRWYCHSQCQCGGDVYSLEMRLSGCDFPEALETVHEIVNRTGPLPTKPTDRAKPTHAEGQFRLKAEFIYRDELGKPLFKSVRKEREQLSGKPEKIFPLERHEGGRWVSGLDGVRHVVYRLYELNKTPREALIFVPEGEKCVHAVVDLGLPATCNPMGAAKSTEDGKLRCYSECASAIAGRSFVVMPDFDQRGRIHAIAVARLLLSFSAVSVRIIEELPGCGEPGFDVADWKAAGGTRQQLVQLAEAAAPLDSAGIDSLESKWGLAPDGASLSPKLVAPNEPSTPEQDSLPAFPEIAWRGPFATYRRAMSGTTEASDVAHFVSFWAACSVALGRRAWFHLGTKLYPNVYLCLFGPSGEKKTTGMRGPLENGLIAPHVKVLKNAGSTEGMLERLTKDSHADGVVGLIFLEEFASLLVRGNWSNSTLLEFLTEAYDCPEVYELLYREKNAVSLRRPTISLVAGSTTDWFWKNAREEHFHGGALNRIAFFSGRRKGPVPRPRKPDATALKELSTAVGGLSQIPVMEARLSQQAEKVWDRFYIEHEQKPLPGLLGVATKRLTTYALKLAMVYAALERTSPEITLDQLKAAIAVALYAEACARELIDSRSTTASLVAAEKETRFINWVRNHEGETKRHMQQTMSKYCNAEEFNRLLLALEKAGHVEVKEKRVYLAR